MNIHKKLLSIGFKKSPFYIGKRGDDKMIIDDYELKTKFINGKYVTTKVKVVHSKNESFYKMVFTDDLTVWAHTKSDEVFRIYLEGSRIKWGLDIIEYPSINSKIDIIKLLPKDVQRDLIINSLFK